MTPRILVAGVAVLDFVFHVDEMPREAVKYRANAATISGGGNAANAAAAIARLGGAASLATRLGDDEVADLIEAGLRREGIDTGPTRRFPGHHSAFSSVFVAGDERQIVSFRDWDMPREAVFDAIGYDAALADTRWAEGAAALMRAKRAAGKPAVIDVEAPIAGCEEALEAATHVAFSAQGLEDFCGHADLERGLAEAERTLTGIVLVTDGEHGTFWYEDGERRHAPAHAIEAVDTLAAGDVWHGAFTLELAKGRDLECAVRYANAAASLKCTRRGGRDGAPTAAEVEKFLKEQA